MSMLKKHPHKKRKENQSTSVLTHFHTLTDKEVIMKKCLSANFESIRNRLLLYNTKDFERKELYNNSNGRDK